MSKLKKDDKIFIAGHTGMVGSAIERKFRQEGFTNILTFSSKDLDLRNQSAVDKFFKKLKPDFVILAAAKVGGIHANNKYKADLIKVQLSILFSSYSLYNQFKFHSPCIVKTCSIISLTHPSPPFLFDI